MIKTVTDPSQINPAEDVLSDLRGSLTPKNLDKAAAKTAEKMDEVKNRETQRGKSPAEGGRWDNRYNRDYARRQGKPRSPVTLRSAARRNTIERTFIQTGANKGGFAKLRFKDKRKGVIFGYHDRGIRYPKKGFTQRQIYPETDKQVPADVDATAENQIFRILNG